VKAIASGLEERGWEVEDLEFNTSGLAGGSADGGDCNNVGS